MPEFTYEALASTGIRSQGNYMCAPARRDLDATEDWGGGVRRGSSGHRDGDVDVSEPMGGRYGRTRTTGTSGGIGASGGSYRVPTRRRGS